MKHEITLEELKRAITVCSHVTKTVKDSPATSTLHFQFGASPSVSATDVDTAYVLTKLDCQTTIEEEEFFIPINTIMLAVNQWDKKSQITIDVKEKETVFKCGKSTMTIKHSDTNIPVPTRKASEEFRLASTDFRKMLGLLTFIIAKDNYRPQVSGIFPYEDFTVATDGFTLAGIDLGYTINGIVPRLSAKQIASIFGDAALVTIRTGEGTLEVEDDETFYFTTLVEAKPISLEHIVPETTETNFEISSKDLANALERCAIILAKAARISITAEEVKVESKVAEDGTSITTIPITNFSGEPIVFDINPEYTLKALTFLKSSTVRIGVNKKEAPIIIKHLHDEEQFVVIMPMRNVAEEVTEKVEE